MTLDLVRRSTKGEPLTAADHDGNLDKIEGAIEAIDPAADVAAHVAEPDPHPQYVTEIEGDARYATAAQGALADSSVQPSDPALSDAREWSAETISQAEAETGSATTRRAFTAQRVFQAVAAWWAGSTAASKLAGIASGATANASDAQLRDRSTHTGTQPASTITGLAAVATSGAYGDLSGRPTLGSAAATDASAYATAAQGARADSAVQPAALSGYVPINDPSLSNQRTPTDGSVTDQKIAPAGLSASSINWTGITPWAANTAYAKGALVEFQGIAYRRSAAGTSGATFNTANWQQITPTNVAQAVPVVTTSAAGLAPATGTPSGRYLRDDGTWSAAPGGATANYQEFTSSGTWTKPPGISMIYVEAVSGGPGGGSGRRGAAGTVRCGGGGGAGGRFVSRWMAASAAGSTETITVGAGGAGGAAVTTDDTNGNNGSSGGSSSFGSLVIAAATNGGSGGTASSGTGGTALPWGPSGLAGLYFVAGAAATAAGGSGAAGFRCMFGPGSGGSGGGFTSTDTVGNGGGGGQGFAELKNTQSTGGSTAGGGSGGSAGAPDGLIGPTFGDGGGGGRTSGAGGAGAFPGGGGGGGGASLNGSNSGAGGAGGNGVVRVWCW